MFLQTVDYRTSTLVLRDFLEASWYFKSILGGMVTGTGQRGQPLKSSNIPDSRVRAPRLHFASHDGDKTSHYVGVFAIIAPILALQLAELRCAAAGEREPK
jgi:hypothetical protein